MVYFPSPTLPHCMGYKAWDKLYNTTDLFSVPTPLLSLIPPHCFEGHATCSCMCKWLSVASQQSYLVLRAACSHEEPRSPPPLGAGGSGAEMGEVLGGKQDSLQLGPGWGPGPTADSGLAPSLVMMMECWVEEEEEAAPAPPRRAWSLGR